MKSKLSNIFLYSSLVSIGIVVGIAIRHYYYIPLSESINIVDVATLATTVFLAIYVPSVINRKIQKTKDKKMLIVQRIEELQMLLRKINLLVQSDIKVSARNILIVNNSLDIVDYKIRTISLLLNNSRFNQNYKKEVQIIRELCEQHKKTIKVEEPIKELFVYPPEVQQKEELLFNRIDEASSLLIFKVSDL